MIERPIVEIAPRTWIFSDYKLSNMYLLEGDERALLIDTGSGLGDLVGDIKKLTSKPLTVIITHGHLDHIGGNSLFEEVLMHKADEKVAGDGYTLEKLEWFVRSRGPVRNPSCDAEELVNMLHPLGEVHYRWLEGGEILDLGNRKVEVIATPGHSLGSICILDHNQRLLFTGDMANDSLLLNFGDQCTTMYVYNQSMKKLWDRREEYDYICLGHDALDKFDKNVIAEYIEATDKLIRGEVKGEKSQNALHGGIGYRAGRIIIWYDPDRLQ